MEATREDGGWPLRPVILAAIGVATAVFVQQLLHQDYRPGGIAPPPSAARIAIAAMVVTAALSFGYVAERTRLLWAAAFAGVVGIVAGLVFWWNNGPSGEFLWDWRSAALFLAIAIAAPLFQTARDEAAWRYPYPDVHAHAWTNVVLWFASWGFTAIVFAMAFLLSELFQLIGIQLLRDLLREGWFVAALGGSALGGALGLFRERDRVLRLLQRVVTAVLSVLAPVLGAALLLFLLSLPFTGLAALWEATKATTPILLSCVVGALILCNAVVGSGEEGESTNPVLLISATALALVMLPFAVIAAIATGLRIQQYGFTPDRLWALTFVIVACAYGLGYLVSVLRGRTDWAERVRPANLRLGFALAGLALFLALPIVSFNAISTGDQVARLKSGRVSADKFDWAALAFDFGEPGKRALKQLTASGDPVIAARARAAATKDSRYEVARVDEATRDRDALASRVHVVPEAVPLPPALLTKLTDYQGCGSDAKETCTVYHRAGSSEAIALQDQCVLRVVASRDRKAPVAPSCDVARLVLAGGEWRFASAAEIPVDPSARQAIANGLKRRAVEVRTVPRRQLFVGGQPVGASFE